MSLPQALGYSAVNLALHNQRIEDLSAVIHGSVIQDFDATGFLVHFHNGDVGSKGIGKVGRGKALNAKSTASIPLGSLLGR